MKLTLSKINLPQGLNWGIVEIVELEKTYFRFDIKNDQPVLDTSFFTEKVEVGQKHFDLEKGSELYQSLQDILDVYFTEISK